MKEVKYINHIVRNGVSYVILYIVLNLIYGYTQSIFAFIVGLLALTVGYAPVYFLNDYVDRFDDIKHKKANLYNTIDNRVLFFTLVCVCIFIGVGLSLSVSLYSFFLLILLYLLNIVYSVKPLRLRNVVFLRELTLFIINIVKWFFIISLMQFDPLKSPFAVMLMGSALLAAHTVVYKRFSSNTKHTNISFYFFGSITAISWVVMLIQYKQLFFLFFPLFPLLIFAHFRYKNRPAPNLKYFLAYLLYFCIVAVLQLIYNHR